MLAHCVVEQVGYWKDLLNILQQVAIGDEEVARKEAAALARQSNLVSTPGMVNVEECGKVPQ
jgi:hypothetical protein